MTACPAPHYEKGEIYEREFLSIAENPISTIRLYLSSQLKHQYITGVQVETKDGQKSPYFGVSAEEENKINGNEALFMINDSTVQNIQCKYREIMNERFLCAFRVELPHFPMEQIFCSDCKETPWYSMITSSQAITSENIPYGLKIWIRSHKQIHVIDRMEFMTVPPAYMSIAPPMDVTPIPLSSVSAPPILNITATGTNSTLSFTNKIIVIVLLVIFLLLLLVLIGVTIYVMVRRRRTY